MFDTVFLIIFMISSTFSNLHCNAANTDENVTVFFKSWPFRLVQKECESSFLNDYRYTSAMVSATQDKKQTERFEFKDLFKFQTPLGTIRQFSDMIKSCEKNQIKVYVSVKLITNKQINLVIKRYEEIEPFLLHNNEERDRIIAHMKEQVGLRALQPNGDSATPADTNRPLKFDENFMTQRQHKNTKYLMELVLLSATNYAGGKPASSLIQSFKKVNKRYRLRYKRSKILSETSGVPRLLRKYCKLKYKLENIEPAVRFLHRLIKLGVSGIRVENSRYIDSSALEYILNTAQKRAAKEIAIILDDVQNINHYQQFGSIMDEEYARQLMDAVKKVNFSQLVSKNKVWPQGWKVATSEKSRPYVPKYMLPEDKKDDRHNFKIATSMMLANPYGFPIIVSPYSRLKKRIKSLPSVEQMTMKEICNDGKFCIHRKKFIRQLVLFRLITSGETITSFKSLSNNILYLNRGKRGFVAFIHRKNLQNEKNKNDTLTIKTDLPAGMYCNIITAYPDLIRGGCHTSSLIEVNRKGEVVLKKTKAYEKGVIAIDILSRMKYMDIAVSGNLAFDTKPKKHPGGMKPRDLEELETPEEISLQSRSLDDPSESSFPSYNPSTSMSTREVRGNKLEFEFKFPRIDKLFDKAIDAIKDFFKEIVKLFKKVTRRHHHHHY